MSINDGKLIDDGKGQVAFKQPKKTVYVRSPRDLSDEIFSRLSPIVGSFDGLDKLFVKLEKALTSKLNESIDGRSPEGEPINMKDVYFLIYNKLRHTDSPTILTDDALKLFFDATNEIQLINDTGKNVPINAGAMKMVQETEAMDSLLASLVQGSK